MIKEAYSPEDIGENLFWCSSVLLNLRKILTGKELSENDFRAYDRGLELISQLEKAYDFCNYKKNIKPLGGEWNLKLIDLVLRRYGFNPPKPKDLESHKKTLLSLKSFRPLEEKQCLKMYCFFDRLETWFHSSLVNNLNQ